MPPAKRFKPYTPSSFKPPKKVLPDSDEEEPELTPYQDPELCLTDDDMAEESEEELDIEEEVEHMADAIQLLNEELDELKSRLNALEASLKLSTLTSTTQVQPSLQPTLQTPPVLFHGQLEQEPTSPEIGSLVHSMETILARKSSSISGASNSCLTPTQDMQSTSTSQTTPLSRSNTVTQRQPASSTTTSVSWWLNGPVGTTKRTQAPKSN